MSKSIETRVEETFAAPGFRKYQKEAIVAAVEALEGDKEVVILDAPTGSGKSLINDGVVNAYGGTSFVTTPLNALVDQLDNDEFMADRIMTIKGRNNYSCVHPDDYGEPVDTAICQRESDFDCSYKKTDCPYYSRKHAGINHDEVATNMSFLMADSQVPQTEENEEWVFGDRDILVLDECQSLEDFAMNYVSFTVSQRTVPDDVWYNITLPPEEKEDDMEYLIEWCKEELLNKVDEAIVQRDSAPSLTTDETKEMEQLNQFRNRVEIFLDDIQDNDWVAQYDMDFVKRGDNKEKYVFEPVEVGRFLDSLLWNRADNIILSSATVPGGDWLEEMELGDCEKNGKIRHISVPSTFPLENRPIITDHAIGKMTYSEREDNAWPMAKKIKEIAGHYEGEKGFVHCRSYGIAEMLKRAFQNHQEGGWFKENVVVQDRYNREESLEKWEDGDKPLFFSVAMEEGISLDGDKCRYQVLAKVPYPNMKNKRVKYRVEERGEWDWYNRKASIQVQQAYGRGVRSKEDWCHFYILDSSAKGLFRRDAELFQTWFLDALDMNIDASRGM